MFRALLSLFYVGDHSFEFVLICDSYIGLDVRSSINIHVLKKPAPVLEDISDEEKEDSVDGISSTLIPPHNHHYCHHPHLMCSSSSDECFFCRSRGRGGRGRILVLLGRLQHLGGTATSLPHLHHCASACRYPRIPRLHLLEPIQELGPRRPSLFRYFIAADDHHHHVIRLIMRSVDLSTRYRMLTERLSSQRKERSRRNTMRCREHRPPQPPCLKLADKSSAIAASAEDDHKGR